MRYVALLRGIGPLDPNMRNEKLRGVFEDLDFRDVETVITTGNVIFDADSSDAGELEATIEAAWPEKLNFESTTIIRTREQMEQLVAHNPFGDREDTPSSRLHVTFLKHEPRGDLDLPDLPHTPDHGDYTIVAISKRAVFAAVNPDGARAADLTRWLEQTFGKEITTRAWTTVNRIVGKLIATNAK